MRSSELSRLDAVTAAVAASTTKVIWELERLLESVLLVLRDETRDCLELLVEMRLALSSPITVEARVVTVVSLSSSDVSVSDVSVSVVSVSDVVDAPPPLSLLLPQEIIVRLKMDMRIMYKTFFIMFLRQ